MEKKRALFIRNVVLIIFICLICRFFYLQLINAEKLTKQAYAQKMNNIRIEKERGDILDRNGIPFTGTVPASSAVLKPLELRNNNEEVRFLSYVLNENYNQIKDHIESKNSPILIETSENAKKKILEFEISGVSFINYFKRYDNSSLAKHVIGYLNAVDKTGETGIEKKYEKYLAVNGQNSVAVIYDGFSNPIQGLGYRLITSGTDTEKINVKLTLDYHIQKIVEDVMERNNIKGAVVIEDVYTGDIIAMASKPDFNQNRVTDYLNSSSNELFNRAVASYNVGSVFKTVVAAAAIESGNLTNKKYYCPGYVKIGNIEFGCSKREGHGFVDFEDGFAYSCNTYFINLGIELGAKSIINMAEKFGFGKPTGINNRGIDDSPGNIPAIKSIVTDGQIANISIGQGDIMATPLQVADMIATIANGGIKNSVNIVDSLIDSQDNIIQELKVKKGTRVISYSTANILKSMMEDVVDKGTGKRASLYLYGGAAGKTGSAEGPYVNGQKTVHAWFAGFFPRSSPKYAMAVFIENGRYGGEVAAPIFAEIAEEIMKSGL